MESQVLPAIISLFFPGVGQLLQGGPERTRKGCMFLIFWVLAWMSLVLLIGIVVIPIIHIWACIDAAGWRPKAPPPAVLLLLVALSLAAVGCGPPQLNVNGPERVQLEVTPPAKTEIHIHREPRPRRLRNETGATASHEGRFSC